MLRALCLAVSTNPARRLTLFKAHCADEALRAELTDALPLSSLAAESLLPQPLREDIELLLEAMLAGNANLQGLIHELAAVYRLKKQLENVQPSPQ